MAFRKARSKQAFLKIALYGPAGSGKSFTALLLAEGLAKACGKRVAYLDTELGTDFYAETMPRPCHPEAFDFDRVDTKSLARANQEIDNLDTEKYGVLVIDSVTHFWDAAIEAYSGNKTSVDSIPLYAWSKIKKPYKKMIASAMNGSYHFIIAGRQKNVFGPDDSTGELTLLGVAMKAEGETAYDPHVLIRMLREPGQGKKLAPVTVFVEKDRSGLLAGKTIVLPADQKPGYTFEQLAAPLLAVMKGGGAQPKLETVDEAAAKDSEAAAEEEAVKKRRSADLVRRFKASLELADTAEAVEKISKGMTPAVKRQMLPGDVSECRKAYRIHADRLKGVAAEPKKEPDTEPDTDTATQAEGDA